MTEPPIERPDEPAATPLPLEPDLADVDGATDGSTAGAAAAARLDGATVPAGKASVAATQEAEPPDAADASLLNLIDRLSALLDRTELTELEVQVGSTGLVLRKPSAIAPPAPAAVQVPSDTSPGADAAQAATAAADPVSFARPAVMAPLSGIWYGSPSPGSAPYVSLGGEVAVGQVIGLIEAMKLFNEIKSDKAGRVVKINAEDGKLVRAKQPLIEVDPL
ncbi:MAG TPA: biotin/lipoyl-containing protein [Candidatus Limnocylindria bacterium]|nr:biotin/lipoyl-containing protein [Candidatus Limnocylindria bacterium]